MGRILCVGDIHGNYRALMQCLERSKFDYDNDTLISLGDVIDGHSDNFEVVEELLKIKNLIAIKGNHDDWFSIWLQTGHNPSGWRQGQKATGLSYLKHSRGEKVSWMRANEDLSGWTENISLMDIPISHVNFFKNQLPYYIDDKNNLFVHGGFNRNIPLDEQGMDLWWDRDLWRDAVKHSMSLIPEEEKLPFNMIQEFNNIYIGHTSTQFIGHEVPVQALNIINLDQGAGGTGKLTIMNIDSKEFWQSDAGMELYPEYKGRG